MNILGLEITIKVANSKLYFKRLKDRTVNLIKSMPHNDRVYMCNALIDIFNKNVDGLTLEEEHAFIRLISEITTISGKQTQEEMNKTIAIYRYLGWVD